MSLVCFCQLTQVLQRFRGYFLPSIGNFLTVNFAVERRKLSAHGSFLEIRFSLVEFNRNALSANFALSVHVDELFILILESSIYLYLETWVNGWVVLADDDVRDGNLTWYNNWCSLQFFAWFDSNFVDLRLIEVDWATHPALHLFVLAVCTSLVPVNEGALIEALHKFSLVFRLIHTKLLLVLLLWIRVVYLDLPLVDLV